MIDDIINIIKKLLYKILSKIKKGINNKKNFIINRFKDYIDKYILSKINILKKNRMFRIRFKALSIMALIMIIGGTLYMLVPKTINHYKSDNYTLSFVEHNTNPVEEKPQPETTQPTPVSNPSPVVDNSYGWPTNSNYYISTYFSGAHDGIDIAGTGYGTNVYSITHGEVVTSSYTSINGNYIVIRHDDGKYSMYAHLSQRYVGPSQRVEKGTVIGAIGSTGRSTGPHLHFSIWIGYPYRGGTVLNPYNFY